MDYSYNNMCLPTDYLLAIFILKKNFGAQVSKKEFQKISFALNYAKQKRKEIKNNFFNFSLSEICGNLKINLVAKTYLFDKSLIFAYLETKTNTIFYDCQKIKLVEEIMANNFELKINLKEFIIAHELFHFLVKDKNNLKGKYNEIAAFKFAKEFLNLDFNPLFYLINNKH